MAKRKALFIDRDGVVNRMVKYDHGWDSPQKPKDVKLVAGIEKIISWANKNKIMVIEVSNQPSVAKRKMSQKVSDAIEEKVHQLLEEKGAIIDKIYICPHHPEAKVSGLRKNCNCRKPKPGLLLKSTKETQIKLSKSVLLGDKATDVEAGEAAGCKTIIFLHDEDEKEKVKAAKKSNADYRASSLNEAEKIIEGFF